LGFLLSGLVSFLPKKSIQYQIADQMEGHLTENQVPLMFADEALHRRVKSYD